MLLCLTLDMILRLTKTFILRFSMIVMISQLSFTSVLNFTARPILNYPTYQILGKNAQDACELQINVNENLEITIIFKNLSFHNSEKHIVSLF